MAWGLVEGLAFALATPSEDAVHRKKAIIPGVRRCRSRGEYVMLSYVFLLEESETPTTTYGGTIYAD